MTPPDRVRVRGRRGARRPTATLRAVLLVPVLVAALVGCTTTAQDESAGTTEPADASTEQAPGGLYVGFYQEDRENNPEDPMPGSFYLWLPAADGEFSGAMSFTYVGCQDTNIGTVSGVKDIVQIGGDWSGTVDENPVGGPYQGLYSQDEKRFAGTYENADGKLHVIVPGCIEYDVAERGAWEMSAPGAKDPATFDVEVDGDGLTWTEIDGATGYLVGVYDVAAAWEGHQAIVGQTFVPAGRNATDAMSIGSIGQTAAGGDYVVAVSAFSGTGDRLGYTSSAFSR